VVHLALLTTAVWLELISSPFVQEGPLVPPQPSSAEQNLEMCAINGGCSDTGQKTAQIQDTLSQAPGESPHSGNSDVIQVQHFDNYESYFEYESGSGNINVKKQIENLFIFLEKYKHFRFYYRYY